MLRSILLICVIFPRIGRTSIAVLPRATVPRHREVIQTRLAHDAVVKVVKVDRRKEITVLR